MNDQFEPDPESVAGAAEGLSDADLDDVGGGGGRFDPSTPF